MTGALDTIAIGLFAVALAVAVLDWRTGMYLCVAVGFLQDPLRKVWSDESVYVTAAVAIVLAVVAAGAGFRGQLLAMSAMTEWRRFLRLPVALFGVLVLVQAIRTLAQYGSAALAGLGLIAYLSPLVGTAVGYAFPRRLSAIRRFLACYAGLSVAVATGVYLGFLGYDWRVLEQVGPGLSVFSQGIELEVYPGFMRSPEVAAWHAAAAACILVILGVETRRSSARLAASALMLFLTGAALLTGRRKALVVILLFLIAYCVSLAYARAGIRRLSAVAVVIALVAWFAIPYLLEPEDMGPRLQPYVSHGASGVADAPERLATLGLGSVEWAIRRHGLLGAGAGTGSQGSQHFGGGVMLVGGAPEGGLGRLATELGLPGLLAIVWIAVALIHTLWRGRAGAQRLPPQASALRYGLLAFLAANAVGFVVASQVYGDLFVLALLGWSIGFVLAIPRLAASVPTRAGHSRPDGRHALRRRPSRSPVPPAR
jgi:hypothetical protein